MAKKKKKERKKEKRGKFEYRKNMTAKEKKYDNLDDDGG